MFFECRTQRLSDCYLRLLRFQKDASLPDFRFVERFGIELLPDPIIPEGEDPGCFFFSGQIGQEGFVLYFSVSTKSGSDRRHSQKRTIVKFTKETQTWKCKSCPKETYICILISINLLNRDCEHITASKQEANDLHLLNEENTGGPLLFLSGRLKLTTRPISYLPIPPPTWAQLPGEPFEQPFHHGIHLPERFLLNPRARCSCGSSEGVSRSIDDIVIFASSTAIIRQIETTYCPHCSNKRGRVGPDLGEFGVFNWNNRLAFAHELFNNYTSQFTNSITPFFSFHQTIVNIYMSEQSPQPFASFHIFLSAYFAFLRLQQLETDMRCTYCKDNPKAVLADGVSIGFPRHRVMGLWPPTCSDREKALVKVPSSNNMTRATCFLGTVHARVKFENALELTEIDAVCQELRSLMEQFRVIIYS